jgi:hypothetical protein
MFASNAYAIRVADDDDAPTLRRLAELDSRAPLAGRVLIAEHDGVAVAALSIDDVRTIADPFHYTGMPLALLRMRASALESYDRMPSARERIIAALRVAPPLPQGS